MNKYNKQELKQSEKDYKTAKKLKDILSSEKGKNVEQFVWLLNLFCWFVFAVLFRYGAASEMNFLELLVESVIVFSPSILYSAMRHTTRAIIGRIIPDKEINAKLYLQYCSEVSHLRDVYGKSINKIIELAKSNDKNLEKSLEQIKQELEKSEEKSGLPNHEIKQIEALGEEYAKSCLQKLSNEEKKKLTKIFEVIKERG